MNTGAFCLEGQARSTGRLLHSSVKTLSSVLFH